MGLTLASLRNSWGAWEGALPSGQAKPEPGRSIWWPSHPSPGWGKEQPKGTRPGGLSLGPAGLPKLAELVTNKCRRAGAAGLLYPHWRPRAGRQWAPGPVLIVRICGRGHEGAQRAPGLPIPETLDVTRGEDVSIEALDGHWPTPIGRVRGPRPWRSPRASGESPWGSLFAPLLLAFFLLSNPHQLHTSALPADDHEEAVDDSKQTAHDADERRQCLVPALQGLFTGRSPEGIIWLRGQQLEPKCCHSARHSAGNRRESPSHVSLGWRRPELLSERGCAGAGGAAVAGCQSLQLTGVR